MREREEEEKIVREIITRKVGKGGKSSAATEEKACTAVSATYLISLKLVLFASFQIVKATDKYHFHLASPSMTRFQDS